MDERQTMAGLSSVLKWTDQYIKEAFIDHADFVKNCSQNWLPTPKGIPDKYLLHFSGEFLTNTPTRI